MIHETDTEITDKANPFIIVNAYTQFGFGGRNKGEVDVDYIAVNIVMRRISEFFADRVIGYPMIGAGLAGGDWEKISEIIKNIMPGTKRTISFYKSKITGGAEWTKL